MVQLPPRLLLALVSFVAMTLVSSSSSSAAFVATTTTTTHTIAQHPQRQSSSTLSSFSVSLALSADARKKVFIDGEVGTTGLQVRDRLETRSDIKLLSAPAELRKDEATRKRLLNEADAVILCTFLSLVVIDGSILSPILVSNGVVVFAVVLRRLKRAEHSFLFCA